MPFWCTFSGRWLMPPIRQLSIWCTSGARTRLLVSAFFDVELRDMADSNVKSQLPHAPPSAIETVEQHLRQGDPLLAYNAVQDALHVWPGNLRLRQLKGLALARSGDTERANL